MLKQISTYGAIILTTMVVIRAATMEKESKSDIRSLYERSTDRSYITTNLALRNNYLPVAEPTHFLLAANIKASAETPMEHSIHHFYQADQAVEVTDDELELTAISEPIILDEDIPLNDGLSLDGDNTINSNLSVLFPRQRINPKPSSY